MAILSDRAFIGFLALLTLVFTVWGAVSGFFSKVLEQVPEWQNTLNSWFAFRVWLLILVFALAVVGVGAILRAIVRRLRPKRIVTRTEEVPFVEEHGVLWSWPPKGIKWYGLPPHCPDHLLMMTIDERGHYGGEYRFYFVCRGDLPENAHEIRGPLLTEIAERGIHHDVIDRINSKNLKAQAELSRTD